MPNGTRRTKADMRRIEQAIYETVKAQRPMTVRQVFYRLVSQGVVAKTTNEYKKIVIRSITRMRERGDLPWNWITDESRRYRMTQTFEDVDDALSDASKFYRRNAMENAGEYIEVWVEKEALSGVLWPTCSQYDVPLLPVKGNPSVTLLNQAANKLIAEIHKFRNPTIYVLTDYDPGGMDIARSIEEGLDRLTGKGYTLGLDFHVERLALNRDQIDEYDLPTRVTKDDDKEFEDEESCELDALPPQVLCGLVEEAIEQHIDPGELAVLRQIEDDERKIIRGLASMADQVDAE